MKFTKIGKLLHVNLRAEGKDDKELAVDIKLQTIVHSDDLVELHPNLVGMLWDADGNPRFATLIDSVRLKCQLKHHDVKVQTVLVRDAKLHKITVTPMVLSFAAIEFTATFYPGTQTVASLSMYLAEDVELDVRPLDDPYRSAGRRAEGHHAARRGEGHGDQEPGCIKGGEARPAEATRREPQEGGADRARRQRSAAGQGQGAGGVAVSEGRRPMTPSSGGDRILRALARQPDGQALTWVELNAALPSMNAGDMTVRLEELERAGLIQKDRQAGIRGRPWGWSLTDAGRARVGAPKAKASPKQAGTVADLVTEVKAEQDRGFHDKVLAAARDSRLAQKAEEDAARVLLADYADASNEAMAVGKMPVAWPEMDALRAALVEAGAPVALESVELQRDTSGMCTVLVNGRVAIRDNGDIISHKATLDWFAGDRAARAAMEMLSQECDDSDALLRVLGLDPEQYRTEGGSLNLPKIRTALAEAEKAEPYAYLVVQQQGYIVGAWKDRATAEKIAAQQLARDRERVVEVYDRPPRRELSEKAAQEFAEWLCREMPPGTIISNPRWWAPRIVRVVRRAAE